MMRASGPGQLNPSVYLSFQFEDLRFPTFVPRMRWRNKVHRTELNYPGDTPESLAIKYVYPIGSAV